MSTTVPVNNVANNTQLERGTAHPVGSSGHHLFNKDHHATNTHQSTNQFAKDNMNANTGAGDTYGHSDNIVKTGQYATGLENNTTAVPLRTTAHLPSSVSDSHHQATGHGTGLTGTHGAVVGTGLNNGAAHLPAGSAVPVVGGQQNVITGVNNVPTAGPQLQNTAPNAANRDGLVVNDGIGGPLGGAVILGGQCECLANNGSCSHGAGQCVCRGCTAQATTVNPGINIGVSTAQYTAPAGTSGLGGGVADPHTGIAGLVHTNPVARANGNCSCIQKDGVCKCKNGVCTCSNCKSHSSLTGHHTTGTHTGTGHGLFGSHHNNATTTAATTATGLTGATGMHHAARNVDGDGHHALSNQGVAGNHGVIGSSTSQFNQSINQSARPESVIAGSEYAGGNIHPDHVHRGAQPASSTLSTDQSINRANAASPAGPITDNSNPDVFLSQAAGTNTYGTR